MSNTTVFRLVTSSGEEKTTKVQVNICKKKSPTPFSPVPGTTNYYRNRYLDFLERHTFCDHIPPDYYMGPMFILDTKERRDYYEKYAVTSQLREYGVSHKELSPITKRGKEVKPFLGDSYGFKYCAYFSLLEKGKLRNIVRDWINDVRLNLQNLMEQGLIQKDYEAKYDTSLIAELLGLQNKYNNNFEPTDIEKQKVGYDKAKKAKMEEFYTNIELRNERFREFAFATHPEAYMPKVMSEFTFGDLSIIGMTPDFKEWKDEATWRQAFITGENMDFLKLLTVNYIYYRDPLYPILKVPTAEHPVLGIVTRTIGLYNTIVDSIKIVSKVTQKVYAETFVDYDREYVRKNSLKYVRKNSLKYEEKSNTNMYSIPNTTFIY